MNALCVWFIVEENTFILPNQLILYVCWLPVCVQCAYACMYSVHMHACTVCKCGHIHWADVSECGSEVLD